MLFEKNVNLSTRQINQLYSKRTFWKIFEGGLFVVSQLATLPKISNQLKIYLKIFSKTSKMLTTNVNRNSKIECVEKRPKNDNIVEK